MKLREVKLSDKVTVKVVEELTARETLRADDLVGPTKSRMKALKVYALCTVREINNAPINPLLDDNDVSYDALIDRLSGNELNALFDDFMRGGAEEKKPGEALETEKKGHVTPHE